MKQFIIDDAEKNLTPERSRPRETPRRIDSTVENTVNHP